MVAQIYLKVMKLRTIWPYYSVICVLTDKIHGASWRTPYSLLPPLCHGQRGPPVKRTHRTHNFSPHADEILTKQVGKVTKSCVEDSSASSPGHSLGVIGRFGSRPCDLACAHVLQPETPLELCHLHDTFNIVHKVSPFCLPRAFFILPEDVEAVSTCFHAFARYFGLF